MKTGLLAHPFGADYAARIGAQADGQAEHPMLAGLREQARTMLGSHGLPGAKDEAWRFTPLRALAKVPFIPAAAADDVDVTAVPAHVPQLADAARIVLVNGVYRRDLSDTAPGVSVSDLHEDLEHGSAGRLINLLAPVAAVPMAALNAAFMTGGLALHVTGAAAKTIHLISIAAAGAAPVAFHPRISITLDAGAALTLVETHTGLPGAATFANPVTEICVGANASLKRYVQVAEERDSFHLATTAVALREGGRCEAFHLGLGGGLVRQEVQAAFHGTGAALVLNGAYAIDGASHHDFTTVVDHRLPECTSSQVFKGVVGGESRGVYQGRIHVARGAQKTDARQLHKALFLERGPQVDCKPELEIYADDVQCAHGAATGELDPDHLFYLASRGIDPDTARHLLVEGFLADAVDQIGDDSVRALFGAQIRGWLARREAA